MASSDPYNRELTHGEAKKGNALAIYAAMKGIGLHEAMAVGDSENDRSMLTLDLKYTVAMGNAMESIKKTARCCTRTNGRTERPTPWKIWRFTGWRPFHRPDYFLP